LTHIHDWTRGISDRNQQPTLPVAGASASVAGLAIVLVGVNPALGWRSTMGSQGAVRV